MHKKMEILVNAYFDGELHGEELEQVNRHLAVCPDCQAALEEVRQVSHLLKTAPLPEFTSTEHFISNLALKLSHNPARDGVSKKTYSTWWLVPAGLLGVFFFFQTAILVSNLVGVVEFTGLLDSVSALFEQGGDAFWYTALVNLTGGQLGAAQSSMSMLNALSLLGNSIFQSFFLQATIFLLYCAWLTTWFMRRNGRRVIERSHPA